MNIEILPVLAKINDNLYNAYFMYEGIALSLAEGKTPYEAIQNLENIIKYNVDPKSRLNALNVLKNKEILDDYNKNNVNLQHSYNSSYGHVRLCSLSKLKDVNVSEYHKRLFIVRSAKDDVINGISKYNVTLVPQLSPSATLFSDYYRWKKGDFTDEEKELITKENTLNNKIWALYVPRFYNELATRKDLISNMKRLIQVLEGGENVLLICYCPDYNYCHRKILGIELAKRGFKVIFG